MKYEKNVVYTGFRPLDIERRTPWFEIMFYGGNEKAYSVKFRYMDTPWTNTWTPSEEELEQFRLRAPTKLEKALM